LFVIWLFRRNDRQYLWLALACFTACPTMAHFSFGIITMTYQVASLIWIWSISLYVYFLIKFLSSLAETPSGILAKFHLWGMVALVGFVFLMPPGYAYAISSWGNVVITAPASLAALTFLWVHRSSFRPLVFWTFLICMHTAVMLGLYELFLMAIEDPGRSMHLFHFMPLVMSLACTGLILSQLIFSLGEFEALNKTLTIQVAEKSAQLVEIQKKEAIAHERNRIMLDLHDGIGGQLVNALAYLRNNKISDGVIEGALEDALRDLGLMLDSMENHDNIVTLLGMLRLRLESLLEKHGMEFDWQVIAEPILPSDDPSQNLHIARMVQEAITNVIKYAQADTITIIVDEDFIQVSDNGIGFDVEKLASRKTPSNGLKNMKRRCAEIGARFSIESSSAGTVLRILFRP